MNANHDGCQNGCSFFICFYGHSESFVYQFFQISYMHHFYRVLTQVWIQVYQVGSQMAAAICPFALVNTLNSVICHPIYTCITFIALIWVFTLLNVIQNCCCYLPKFTCGHSSSVICYPSLSNFIYALLLAIVRLRSNMSLVLWILTKMASKMAAVCLCTIIVDNITTLSKIFNWSPYIFMLVLKVRFGYTKFMLI